MTGPDQTKLQDCSSSTSTPTMRRTFRGGFVAPYDSVSGHPGYAIEPSFDELVHGLIERVRADPELWRKTAIFITFDEGGGYYDSGYVQLIDFFGDGTRIP